MEMKKVQEIITTKEIQKGVNISLNSLFQDVDLNKYLEIMAANGLTYMGFSYDNNPYELYCDIIATEDSDKHIVNIGVLNCNTADIHKAIDVVVDNNLNILHMDLSMSRCRVMLSTDEVKNGIRNNLNDVLKDVDLYSYIENMLDNNSACIIFEYNENEYQLSYECTNLMNNNIYSCNVELLSLDATIHRVFDATFDDKLNCTNICIRDLKQNTICNL